MLHVLCSQIHFGTKNKLQLNEKKKEKKKQRELRSKDEKFHTCQFGRDSENRVVHIEIIVENEKINQHHLSVHDKIPNRIFVTSVVAISFLAKYQFESIHNPHLLDWRHRRGPVEMAIILSTN